MSGVAKPSRLRLRPASIVVIAIFALISGGLFWGTSHVVEDQEGRLLRERTGEIGAILSNSIGTGLQSSMTSLGTAAQVSAAAFTHAAQAQASIGAGTASAIALVTRKGSDWVVQASAGEDLQSDGLQVGQSVTGERASLFADTSKLLHSGVLSTPLGAPRLASAIGQPTAPSNSIVYAEYPLDPSRPTQITQSQPFDELSVAVYAGDTPVASKLLISTAPSTPIGGKTKTSKITVGDENWLVVAQAKHPLAGAVTHNLPLILCLTAVLIGVLMAALVEAISRRHDYAVSLVNDRTAALEDSLATLEHTQQALVINEYELIEARDHAMKASQLKSQFLANMSHEIRTPMNGVLGAAALLATTEISKDQRTYVEILAHSGASLLAIINNILDFSKIEAGHLEVQNSIFTLVDPIADIVDMLTAQASAKGLLLKLQTSSGLPDKVIGDPVRLRQIVTNLVGNAVKFTDDGSVIVSVEVTAETSDTVTIRCEIADSGIGIGEQDVTRLFKDFSQVDTSNTRRFGGTGLGLAICDRLIKLMGGEIGCKPNPTGGTVFWFTLPLELASPRSESTPNDQNHQAFDQIPSTPQPIRQAPATSIPEGPRVLIVEDNEVNALILTRMLTLLGYRSDAVSSGVAALEAINRQSYATVLMDCQMPVMDGFTTTQRLRAQTKGQPRIPVVAITATATTEDQQKCFAAGMDDYLPKPIIMEQLVAVLEKWVPSSVR